MEKEWIACNCCGADSFRALNTIDHWPIGKCGKCGLVYVNPVPLFEPNDEFSTISRDFQYTRYMHQPISTAVLAHEKAQLLAQIDKLGHWAEAPQEGLRFLEVGCGSGAAVKAAAELGWQATGLDIDPALIAAGQKQFDVDLRCIPLLQSNLESDSFDFVRLRDVIEHLPNPYACLLEIKRILAPGGVVLLITPNENGLPTRVRRWLGKPPERVATVPPPHHLHGFTPKTYRHLLQRAEFSTLAIYTTTPVDPDYVTSNNMRSNQQPWKVAIWQGASQVGMGSMLVGWGQKESTECGGESR